MNILDLDFRKDYKLLGIIANCGRSGTNPELAAAIGDSQEGIPAKFTRRTLFLMAPV